MFLALSSSQRPSVRQLSHSGCGSAEERDLEGIRLQSDTGSDLEGVRKRCRIACYFQFMTDVRKIKFVSPETCWWCGKTGDSGEHKLKKSDVKRMFDEKVSTQPVWRFSGNAGDPSSDQGKKVQGPNSVELKFPKILCRECNNARSQEFDEAYALFSQYWCDNRDRLLEVRELDLREVYPDDWQNQAILLAKYLLKHVGCRLAEVGMEVPSSISAYLDGEERGFPQVHFGFYIDKSYSYLTDEMTKISKEPHEVMEISDLNPNFSDPMLVDSAFGPYVTRFLNCISGTFEVRSLVVEWVVPFERTVKPFEYPFRSSKYSLLQHDKSTKDQIVEIVAQSGFPD